MTDSFVSRKDRIIASAVEIISDSGLSSLTTHNLAKKENMSEGLLYKYFGGINEVLVEVVEFYFRFDKGIQKTILAKDTSALGKIHDYLEAYATYYDNYYAISTLRLQYEELLHNADTRELLAYYISQRDEFMESLFEEAQKSEEISKRLTPTELVNCINGMATSHIFSRRIKLHKRTFKQEFMANIEKFLELLKDDCERK